MVTLATIPHCLTCSILVSWSCYPVPCSLDDYRSTKNYFRVPGTPKFRKNQRDVEKNKQRVPLNQHTYTYTYTCIYTGTNCTWHTCSEIFCGLISGLPSESCFLWRITPTLLGRNPPWVGPRVVLRNPHFGASHSVWKKNGDIMTSPQIFDIWTSKGIPLKSVI